MKSVIKSIDASAIERKALLDTDATELHASRLLLGSVVAMAHRDLQHGKGLIKSNARQWLTDYENRKTGSLWWYCHLLGIDFEFEKQFVARLLSGEKILGKPRGPKAGRKACSN
ncbi:MAG: hypothetical protein GY874_18420 [Desulfobacteraceae bacterium]|nr:hypothetical protein [Desulfobacteraceae bacterium]